MAYRIYHAGYRNWVVELSPGEYPPGAVDQFYRRGGFLTRYAAERFAILIVGSIAFYTRAAGYFYN